MKKIDLGQAIGILANLGVIAGILLLAYELQQNNALMEAQGRFNRLSIVNAAWGSWAEDADLTELRVRAGKGEILSEVEQRRVEAAVMRILSIWIISIANFRMAHLKRSLPALYRVEISPTMRAI